VSVVTVSYFWFEGDLLCLMADAVGNVASTSVGIRPESVDNASAELQMVFSPERLNPRRPEQTTDLAFLDGIGSRLTDALAESADQDSQLVISPHGSLHDLPVHLLGGTVGCAIDRWAISYTPNLDLYQALVRDSAMHADAGLARCFSTASAEDADATHDRFATVVRPVTEISDAPVIRGPAATKDALLESLQSADIVVVSCHGRFDPLRPRRSCLLLSDASGIPSRSLPRSEGSVTLAEILATPIRAKLVILAACVSGRQLIGAGDEPLGFASALLCGGAQAVLAAQWSLEVKSAAAFLTNLMESWSTPGRQLGQGVRDAYLATRAMYPHPFHWAPFSLYGDPRIELSQSA